MYIQLYEVQWTIMNSEYFFFSLRAQASLLSLRLVQKFFLVHSLTEDTVFQTSGFYLSVSIPITQL